MVQVLSYSLFITYRENLISLVYVFGLFLISLTQKFIRSFGMKLTKSWNINPNHKRYKNFLGKFFNLMFRNTAVNNNAKGK